MIKIHQWFPKRRILCVGDSTQTDPEAYAEIYKKYPGWIQAIFIRKVTDIPHMEQKNSDGRFQDAFKGVPQNVWKVFENPEELYEHVGKLKVNVEPEEKTVSRRRSL
jgi:phosphatidate phosphatase APP1